MKSCPIPGSSVTKSCLILVFKTSKISGGGKDGRGAGRQQRGGGGEGGGGGREKRKREERRNMERKSGTPCLLFGKHLGKR